MKPRVVKAGDVWEVDSGGRPERVASYIGKLERRPCDCGDHEHHTVARAKFGPDILLLDDDTIDPRANPVLVASKAELVRALRDLGVCGPYPLSFYERLDDWGRAHVHALIAKMRPTWQRCVDIIKLHRQRRKVAPPHTANDFAPPDGET